MKLSEVTQNFRIRDSQVGKATHICYNEQDQQISIAKYS